MDRSPNRLGAHGELTAPVRPIPSAARIMVIRHGEKPGNKAAPFGVDQHGNSDPDSLSPLGWQRAGALTVFFAPARGALQDPALSVPQFLFACGHEKERKRLRPLQTITLLAERLHASVDTTFIAGEEAALADFATSCPGVVLISWEHKHIHLIANRILGDSNTAPQAWPEDRFDLVWVFDLQGGSYRFKQIPQLLLPGDLDRGI